MIREASVYTLKKLSPAEQQPYGLRVLTMRRWPRGVRRSDIDLWMASAGPSLELLSALHLRSLSWDDFLARYRAEQLGQRSCRVVTYEGGKRAEQGYPCRSIDHLRRLEQQHGVITVLCWENGPTCHRYTLVELLQEWSAQDCEASLDST